MRNCLCWSHAELKQAFDGMVKEICNALVEADVNIKLVAGLRTSIKKSVNFKELGAGVNKKRVIQKVDRDIPRSQRKTDLCPTVGL